MNPTPTTLVYVDAENLAGDREDLPRGFVAATSLKSKEAVVTVVGKETPVREEFVEAWQVALPGCASRSIAVPPRKQSADVFLAFLMGRDLAICAKPCAVWLLTHDQALLGLKDLIEGMGHHAFTMGDFQGQSPTASKKRTKTVATVVAPLNREPSGSRFEVFEADENRHLGWLEFPPDATSFCLGSTARTADLSVEPFFDAQPGIHDRHVELYFSGLPSCEWSVEAKHGFRRSLRHRTVLNDTILSVKAGRRKVNASDELIVGPLRLILHQNLAGDLVARIDPKDLAQEIETILSAYARSLPRSAVPTEVLQRLDSERGLDWRKAYFKELAETFAFNWQELDQEVKECFPDEQVLRRSIDPLNRARNSAMHPTKGPVSLKDRRALAQFWVDLTAVGTRRSVHHVERLGRI